MNSECQFVYAHTRFRTLSHMRTNELKRLIALDAALASLGGLHIGDLARQFNCSARTIRRDLNVLRDISPVICRRVPAENHPGHSYRHWYADKRHRVFAPTERPNQ